ncbi:ATP-binding protein [Fusibacter bizertensis]|uniref:ATP-binding protein n=1 Tax=Fusibacter bizertensis TaxID=1488331 RepID=A0ABT6NER5_9FIRM|nr:ATP-binding protein [Fusibacter bizertensis]MDH8678887.1 ATP-binding protein [Fusibacter bizertensis]
MKRWMENLYLKSIRKAIETYAMIDEGDRILIGVSGGKDSSLLFYALNQLSQFGPKSFKVTGLTVDHGLIGNLPEYKVFCKENGLDLMVYEEHYAVNLSHGKTYAPCYTCSRLRKGIIKRYAIENGYNKIAMGHTKDDLVETFMMNILQHGKMATMRPISETEEGLVMIRPLMFLEETAIIKSIEILKFPLMMDTCEFADDRLRSKAEDLINQIELTIPEFSDKVIQALSNVDLERLL